MTPFAGRVRSAARHALFAAVLLAAGCRSTAPTGQTGTDAALSFVQITDTHLGVGGHRYITERLVDLINRMPIPIVCVVHTGDIVADQLDRTNIVPDLAAFDRLKAPVHYVPGNHDILDKRYESTLSAYTNRFGPTCSRAEHQGVVFLFLALHPDSRTGGPDGADPLDWLEEQLRTAGQRPVLVFQHYPGVDDFHNNEFHPAWRDEPRHRRWISLLGSRNVKAVIAGHFHRDELHWLPGGVPLYVAQPVARFWGRQPCFRVYEYRDGRLSYRTVYLEETR